MCHGYEWEMFKAAQMREIESRKREEKSKAFEINFEAQH